MSDGISAILYDLFKLIRSENGELLRRIEKLGWVPTAWPGPGSSVGQEVPDAPSLRSSSRPKTLSEQASAVHAALAGLPTSATAEDIHQCFLAPKPERIDRIEEILETLTTLGKARELDGERYVGV